ncbi:MAG: HPr family phosphocarrier protein [Lachnospiraceae bacterium]|jgi:phosphotransferase system HPr-like phosphotransfer protein|nr:HPr family phosphocarrier protein [Lachnospiraceae bacterium]
MEEIKQIKLNAPEEVKDFVKAAEKCNFDIDVFYNRFVVDAKSFLGVISLDLSRILNVTYRGFNSDFETIIAKYSVMQS